MSCSAMKGEVLPQKLRCGIYVRKSRKDRDKESHRLEVQREKLPAYATSQGWQLSVFDDGYASGVDQANLPHLQNLINRIRTREIDIVLCIELSRLSRDDTAVQYLQFIDVCRSNGVKLATPGQILDPRDP
ncbi:MAG: recombinase family protein, partial [Pseudomonadota bacterium]